MWIWSILTFGTVFQFELKLLISLSSTASPTVVVAVCLWVGVLPSRYQRGGASAGTAHTCIFVTSPLTGRTLWGGHEPISMPASMNVCHCRHYCYHCEMLTAQVSSSSEHRCTLHTGTWMCTYVCTGILSVGMHMCKSVQVCACVHYVLGVHMYRSTESVLCVYVYFVWV